MDRKKIGRFYAITNSNNALEFFVYDDNTIDCPMLNLYGATQILLKPRFELYGNSFSYISDRKELIIKYDIDEYLLCYLKNNKMIDGNIDSLYDKGPILKR